MPSPGRPAECSVSSTDIAMENQLGIATFQSEYPSYGLSGSAFSKQIMEVVQKEITCSGVLTNEEVSCLLYVNTKL